MVGNAVFDPLAAYDSSGKWQPYLAKSLTPSADYKTWTIAMRPGVTFSDGTPVDGAAVAKSLSAARCRCPRRYRTSQHGLGHRRPR